MSMTHQDPNPGPPATACAAPQLRSFPLWARVAVERLDACAGLRSEATLDELLIAYAKTYGEAVPAALRASVHELCRGRFAEFQQTLQDAVGEDPQQPSPDAMPPDVSLIAKKMLDCREQLIALSTAHLRPETLHSLTDGTASVLAYPNDYGALVYVGERQETDPDEPDLDAIFKLARQIDIIWIKFDGDALQVDGLPTYEHPQPND